MDEKRNPVENEIPKYKKKSKKRGQPRADHKHEYKTVLVLHKYTNRLFPDKTTLYEIPKKGLYDLW